MDTDRRTMMSDRTRNIMFWVLLAAEVMMLGFVFLWMAAQQVGY